MNKKLLLFLITPFILCGCFGGGQVGTDPIDPDIPSVNPPVVEKTYNITFNNYNGVLLQKLTNVKENTIPEYTLDTPTRLEDNDYFYTFAGWTPAIVPAVSDAVYTASYSSTPKETFEDEGTKTIEEARDICMSLADKVNEVGIAVDMSRTITINAIPLMKFTTVKTKAPYNLCAPYKTIMGDDTGYIGCSSLGGNNGNTLWGKVGDYAGSTAKSYTITGYPSLYMNQPELYVPGKTYTMQDNEGITFDAVKHIKSSIDLDGFYDEACLTQYGISGYGYGRFYTIKNVRVVDNKDKLYICTDSQGVMKVFQGNCKSLIPGKTYDITGVITLQDWIPSLYAFDAKISEELTENIFKSAAISTTITDFKKNKSSQDDTTAKMDSYIRLFKNVYKANVYVTCVAVNNNLYVSVSDTYYSGEFYLQSHITAQNSHGMIEISNNNYWNIDLRERDNYCPLKDYIDQEETVEFYFSPFLLDWGEKKPLWKVFAYNHLLELD